MQFHFDIINVVVEAITLWEHLLYTLIIFHYHQGESVVLILKRTFFHKSKL